MQKISDEEIREIHYNLGISNFPAVWEVVKKFDSSAACRRRVVDIVKKSLLRKTSAENPHSKFGGIPATSANSWMAMDTFFLAKKNCTVLHAINMFTKFSRVKILDGVVQPNAKHTIEFLEELRLAGGLCKKWLVDQGGEFANRAVAAHARLHRCQVFVAPKSPWVNGTIERRHRTIKNTIRRLRALLPAASETRLTILAVSAVNENPTTVLDGLSPYETEFLKRPPLSVSPEDATEGDLENITQSIEERSAARQALESLARDKQYRDDLKKLHSELRKYYSSSKPVEAGDLIEFYDRDGKTWLGPARVIEVRSRHVTPEYVVEFQSQFKRVHRAHCRRFIELHNMQIPPNAVKIEEFLDRPTDAVRLVQPESQVGGKLNRYNNFILTAHEEFQFGNISSSESKKLFEEHFASQVIFESEEEKLYYIDSAKAGPWAAALKKEIGAHVKREVFRQATEADRRRYKGVPIPCKILYSVKRDGTHKCRVICMGFLAPKSQISTYAEASDISTFRFLLSMLAQTGQEVLSFDAVSAFIGSPYHEHTVVRLCPELADALGYEYAVVLRGLNGLPLSPKFWEIHRDKELRALGWRKNKRDGSLYLLPQPGGPSLYMLCHVDDFWMQSADGERQRREYLKIKDRFDCKECKPEIDSEGVRTFDFLSIDVSIYPAGHVWLDQRKYSKEVVSRFPCEGRPVATPGTTENLIPYTIPSCRRAS